MEALRLDENYTYADYAKWELKEGERYELIDGVPYAMAAPSPQHQGVSTNLLLQIGNFLKGKKCRVFHAPFDVRLFAEGDFDRTVVQPDLLVICDIRKIDSKGCNGSPDLAIEIISHSSAKMDRLIKFNRYQKAGVCEYWMVDMESNTVDVAVLINGRYNITRYSQEGTDTIPSCVLDGFQINVQDVFSEI
jgi:Uma2 family endonuclease